MMSTWYERQTATPEDRKEYEQERLLLEVTDKLYAAMEEAGLNKADLARMLGTSRAHITQCFAGRRNLTLRTVSDLAWAVGHRLTVAVEPLRDGKFISAPVQMVRPSSARIVKHRIGNLAPNTELSDSTLAA
jgi:ribosome-binding protein aMBF1 (putative translation factor)